MAQQLFRSPINKVFGGVCSGLSNYLNLDITLVRVIFIILFFFQGLGLFLYIILWIIVPLNYQESYFTNPKNSINDEEAKSEDDKNFASNEFNSANFYKRKSSNTGRIVAGVILIIIGLVFSAERFLPDFDFADFFPLLLILSGVALLWHSIKTKEKIQ